ncbi:MAG: hypothetical protein JXR73_23700 [Candidatus Omnitrophica bacterium]|nr:hypothetical protein [Candidatus Omnitrophota bacterium]
MKKAFGMAVIVLIAGVVTPCAFTQEIEPIWEFLNTSGNSPVEILKVQDGYPFDNTWFQGDSPTDSFSGLKRYDDQRLLLGIRENGIVEGAEGADEALAAEYPDRSLIWIDPATGQPMGIALVVGIAPYPLSDAYVAGGGTPDSYYFKWGVSEDGVIFVGYKNMILRYAPDGQGGFEEPAVAFEVPADGIDGSGGAQYYSWRWGDVEVMGSGADTVIFAGGKTWREGHGFRKLVTDDGVNFTQTFYVPNGYGNASGGASKIIVHGGVNLDPVLYASTYPGSDGGTGTTFYRWYDFETEAVKDAELWEAQKYSAEDMESLGLDPNNVYRTSFISDMDSADGLQYVIAYSTPSWNSYGANGGVFAPGWLAVHDVSGQEEKDGKIISYYKINTTEDTELYDLGATDDQGNPAATSEWHGTQGEIDVHVPSTAAEGACEILWEGGIYGYGRYVIGDIGEPVSVSEWSLF